MSAREDATALVEDLDYEWSDPMSMRILGRLALDVLEDGWSKEEVGSFFATMVRVIRLETS